MGVIRVIAFSHINNLFPVKEGHLNLYNYKKKKKNTEAKTSLAAAWKKSRQARKLLCPPMSVLIPRLL